MGVYRVELASGASSLKREPSQQLQAGELPYHHSALARSRLTGRSLFEIYCGPTTSLGLPQRAAQDDESSGLGRVRAVADELLAGRE